MLLLWLGVGALVGGVGAVLVRDGPAWAAATVHYAAPSVLLLVLIGATAPRARAAAVRACGCFVAFVLAYYGVVVVQWGAIPVLYAAAWLLAAGTVCPAAAAAVQWASRRTGLAAAAVFAVAGAAAVADGALGNLVRTAVGRLDGREVSPVLWALAPIDLVVALIVVLLVPRLWRTRLIALALLVPASAAATWIGWTLHFGVGPYR